MLTVPEAAKRVGRNPETVRRWIREGKLPARKVGTQHIIEEADLEEMGVGDPERAELPPELQTTFWGAPMPNLLRILHRQRREH